ncbi:hypothetical protein QUA35_01115 [Microcoleus sp. N9_B2]|uniref:hypothetical protein n=1 Tax=unclassified Microcoleus TaxID=2642155 RepID=UPI002FD4945F
MFLVRAIALRMWKFNRGAIAFQVAGLLENSAVPTCYADAGMWKLVRGAIALAICEFD